MITTVIKGKKYDVFFGKDTVTFYYAGTEKIKMVTPIDAKLSDILKDW